MVNPWRTSVNGLARAESWPTQPRAQQSDRAPAPEVFWLNAVTAATTGFAVRHRGFRHLAGGSVNMGRGSCGVKSPDPSGRGLTMRADSANHFAVVWPVLFEIYPWSSAARCTDLNRP
jgi:hypothetical protein